MRLNYFKFHQIYWWLRSPNTGWDDSACLVYPSGDTTTDTGSVGVGSHSYGRDTPVTELTDISWHIYPGGNIVSNDMWDMLDSYGFAEHE